MRVIAIATAVLALATGAFAQTCPAGFTTSVKRFVTGGKDVVITIKMRGNPTTPITDGGVAVEFPAGNVTFKSVKGIKETNAVFNSNPIGVGWTRLNFPANKQRTFRIKFNVARCTVPGALTFQAAVFRDDGNGNQQCLNPTPVVTTVRRGKGVTCP